MRGFNLIIVALAAAALAAVAALMPPLPAHGAVQPGANPPVAPERPLRVVSMNLCTDQLALLIADPGQIVSLTNLAADPAMSALADQARPYPANHGRAEEVYLMHPDLVLAGEWTDQAAVSMLTRLGVPVTIFPAGAGIEDVRDAITRMGDSLGQPERAAALLTDFDARLAAIQPVAGQPRATVYGPGGYAWGEKTLAGAILKAAGYANVATGPVLSHGGYLSLERLAMARPDLIVAALSGGASRAEAVLDHPALRGMAAIGQQRDADWVCAAPAMLDAVADVAAQGRLMAAQADG